MKVVILAGGFGTRISEESQVRPKPMVEIGGKPILWHIMNIYAAGGFKEFVIALGYRGEIIKEYFLNFFAINIQTKDIKHTIEKPMIEEANISCHYVFLFFLREGIVDFDQNMTDQKFVTSKCQKRTRFTSDQLSEVK